jgi:phosphopantetheinyl transferase
MLIQAREDIFELCLVRDLHIYKGYVGFTQLTPEILLSAKEHFLQPGEITIYENLKSDRRRRSFLQGRFIAKQVVTAYVEEEKLTSIGIKPGVFNQPLVSYESSATPLISIAHSDSYAICLAFSDEHPMGIDLERIDSMAKVNIGSQMTRAEKTLNPGEDENTFYTRLWSIKESLSKVLKTGLLIPLEILEVASLQVCAGYTVSNFTNFPQYKALSFCWDNHTCSITLPRETNSDIQSLINRFT